MAVESQPGAAIMASSFPSSRPSIGLVSIAFGLLMSTGCVERTVQPVDPLAEMKGTWKGSRHQLVYDDLGAVVPDTTTTSDLTITVGENAVTFIDSRAGHLSATVLVQSADSLAFLLTDGLTNWTETASRRDHSLNGVERFSPSGKSAGVWAVERQ